MPTKKVAKKTKSLKSPKPPSSPKAIKVAKSAQIKPEPQSDLVGKKLPAFSLPTTGDQTIKTSDLKGKVAVFYFYPKDNTSGCTAEGENFRDEYIKFKKLGASIFGISRDSIKSHEGFKAKFRFQFELISDADEVLCKIFDVIKMKSMYGRKYLGLDRSTFVIQDGKVVKEWRNVKVPGHVAQVLEFVQSL